jgi:hypothetical protein
LRVHGLPPALDISAIFRRMAKCTSLAVLARFQISSASIASQIDAGVLAIFSGPKTENGGTSGIRLLALSTMSSTTALNFMATGPGSAAGAIKIPSLPMPAANVAKAL